MSQNAIETTNISKRYRGDVLAVDRVGVHVGRGEIYGFLGLNGDGQSTMIRMLSSATSALILEPQSIGVHEQGAVHAVGLASRRSAPRLRGGGQGS